MTSRLTRQRDVRWPFWLLLAAWVCANSPQVAIFTVLTWLHEARQFSHQQRLTTEVAYVLGGETAPGILAEVRQQAPTRPTPRIPAEVLTKKIQLSVEQTVDFLPPALRGSRREIVEMRGGDTRRDPPLLGPPRVNQAA